MTIGDKQSTQVFIHYYHPFLKHSIVIGIPPLKSQILLCIRKDLKQSKNSIIFQQIKLHIKHQELGVGCHCILMIANNFQVKPSKYHSLLGMNVNSLFNIICLVNTSSWVCAHMLVQCIDCVATLCAPHIFCKDVGIKNHNLY